jgi:hypothetical protein
MFGVQPSHVEKGSKLLQRHEYVEALREAELALAKKPHSAPALLLKGQALVGIAADESFKPVVDRGALSLKFKAAADTLESYLLRIPFKFDRVEKDADRNQQIRALRSYSVMWSDKSNAEPPFYRDNEVTTKVEVVRTVQPRITTAAQIAQVKGIVVLLAILDADGAVRDILPVQTLPYGLTDEAMRVARQISFKPATKDGRVVSQLMHLEYKFTAVEYLPEK